MRIESEFILFVPRRTRPNIRWNYCNDADSEINLFKIQFQVYFTPCLDDDGMAHQPRDALRAQRDFIQITFEHC